MKLNFSTKHKYVVSFSLKWRYPEIESHCPLDMRLNLGTKEKCLVSFSLKWGYPVLHLPLNTG